MVREDNNRARLEAIDESLLILQQLANLTIGGAEEGEPLPRQMVKIREDQVKNNAGGYVFEVDDLARIRRFLILGTDGGTYYVDEQKLTIENTKTLMECILAGKGGILLREIVDISLAGRAPKQDPLLFALALCARYNVKDRKKLLSKSGDGQKKKEIKEEKEEEEKKEEEEEKVEDKMEEEEKPADEKKTYATVVSENRKKETKIEEEEEEEKCENPKFEEYMMELQRTAMKAVSKVCRIPTHLFQFIKYCELIANSTASKQRQGGGWGRAMRKCVAEWYLQKSPKELAMHLTKYASREGWSHRDLLRLAHPMASQNGKKRKGGGEGQNEEKDLTLVYDQMFHFACTGEFDEKKWAIEQGDSSTAESMPLVKKSRCDYSLTPSMVKSAETSEALEFIRRVKEASELNEYKEGENRCAQLILKFGLVREHVPTKLLNSKTVWIALLEKMPMTALLRNLSKLGTLGLLDEEVAENKAHIQSVCTKLANEEAIHRARIHPISVLLAASIYKQGHGVRGKLSWEPNDRVVEALDQMFLLAFKNVQPTGKRYCLALDVSGSMSSPINGGVLSCREASAAMANVFLRTEEKVECVSFQSSLTPLPFTRQSTVTEMVKFTSGLPFGTTDCSLPMVWAKSKRKQFDCFIVFTDNETWCGKIQPFEALRQYRQAQSIPDAKLAVLGMAATKFTIADPTDPGMMDFVGLDAAIPELLRSFVLDEF